MSRWEWAGIAVVVATSGGAGWTLGARWADGVRSVPPALQAVRHAPELQSATQPAPRPPPVAVLADGRVSVHVDVAPLDWLLQELERQGAPLHAAATWPPGRERATASAAVVDADSGEPSAAEQARLLGALREGAESERHAALVAAQQHGVDVPAELLRRTFESATSDSLRMLAFTSYLDEVSGDGEAVRAVLQSASYNQSAAVQAEARRRLAEFERFESARAAIPAQAAQ